MGAKMAQIIIVALFVQTIFLTLAQATECQILEKAKHGTLQVCEGQKILVLEGSGQERAEAHGFIFKKHLSSRVADYFSGKVREALLFLPKFLQDLAETGLSLMARNQQYKVPYQVRKELKWLSDSSGISRRSLDLAMAAPDFGSWTWATSKGFLTLPKFGCTSAAIVEHDQLLFGRNLDFPGTQVLDRHSLLIVHRPTEANELKRAAFVADGIHFAGISAFNEAGLAIFVHQNFSDQGSLDGVPIIMLIDLILRSAHTTDEAIETIRNLRPGPLWTLVVVDIFRREIATVEVSREVIGVRRSPQQRVFAQTNHILTEEALPYQWISEPLLRNSVVRYNRVQELLGRAQKPMLKDIAEVLSYKEQGLSIFNDIEKPSTVHSVMIEAKQGQEPNIFLSHEISPSSSGTYVKLRWQDLFTSSSRWPIEIVSPIFVGAAQRQNLLDLSEAFRLYEDQHSHEAAIDKTSGSTNPGVQLFRATLFFEKGRYRESRSEAQLLMANERAPKFIVQEGQLLEWLSHYKEGRQELAQDLAQRFLQQKIANGYWERLALKFLRFHRLSKKETEIVYDTFSGQINSPAEYLTEYGHY
jgi:hypothetical protein